MKIADCTTCAPLRQAWLADERAVPTALRPARNAGVALAAWIGEEGGALRICADCGKGWAVFEDLREGCWEAIELPEAVLALLQGRGSPTPAVAALALHERSQRWILLWLRYGDFHTQEVFDALAAAMSSPRLTAEQLQRLVRGWQELVTRRSDGTGRGTDPRPGKLLDALERETIFATSQDAGRLKRIEDAAQQMTSRLLSARAGFSLSADMRVRWNSRFSPTARSARALAGVPAGTEPPEEAAAAKLQRELLVLQDEAWRGWDRTPDALLTKLIGAYRDMQSWAPHALPGSAAFVVVRDLKALLLWQLRNDRVASAMQPAVIEAVDPAAGLLLRPARFCACTEPDVDLPGCQRCGAPRGGTATLPDNLAPLLPGARVDVLPIFVGASWVPGKSNDRMAICPDCGALAWRHATPADPLPAVRLLSPATRCLIDSQPTSAALLTFIASPDYHRDRFAGARELAWRLCERGWGYYNGRELAQGLIDGLRRDDLCGDVRIDCVDLLSRVVQASVEAIEGGWPVTSRVVTDGSLLHDLAERTPAHVPVEQTTAWRTRFQSAVQAIDAVQANPQSP